MDDFMWDWVLSHQELVFARTSSEQKMHIVKEFQRRGEIVAITGHGRNDALVLKCANLGIAIQSGTNAAKESSDVILLDNNFIWIVQAIETGRLLGDNLKKVAIYLLPGGELFIITYIFQLLFSLLRILVTNLATFFQPLAWNALSTFCNLVYNILHA
jgi:sodium/potassium-transporting ATPase subunit alpha